MKWIRKLFVLALCLCTLIVCAPSVCAVKTAVGSGQACTPRMDKTGRATVKEHLPNPDKSLMVATRFTIAFILPAFLLCNVIGVHRIAIYKETSIQEFCYKINNHGNSQYQIFIPPA